MPLPISGLGTEQRAALCFLLLKDLAQESEDGPAGAMRFAVLEYLRIRGSLRLETPVYVTDFDYTRNTNAETLESDTLEGMGRALAGHEQADGQDVANTRWVLCLTSEEREMVVAAYDHAITQALAVKRAMKNVGVIRDTFTRANREASNLRKELDKLLPELNPGAIALRETRIREAESRAESLKDQYNQACEELDKLRSK